MRNYATQMDAAKRGIVTPEIETVAKKENRPVEFIMERVAKGTIAIPANINHKLSKILFVHRLLFTLFSVTFTIS